MNARMLKRGCCLTGGIEIFEHIADNGLFFQENSSHLKPWAN
jgi:hypothetical protein